MAWNIAFICVIILGLLLLQFGATLAGGLTIGAGIGAGLYRALEG